MYTAFRGMHANPDHLGNNLFVHNCQIKCTSADHYFVRHDSRAMLSAEVPATGLRYVTDLVEAVSESCRSKICTRCAYTQ